MPTPAGPAHESLTETAPPPALLVAEVEAHVGGAGGTVIVTVACGEFPPASPATYVNVSVPLNPGCETYETAPVAWLIEPTPPCAGPLAIAYVIGWPTGPVHDNVTDTVPPPGGAVSAWLAHSGT